VSVSRLTLPERPSEDEDAGNARMKLTDKGARAAVAGRGLAHARETTARHDGGEWMS